MEEQLVELKTKEERRKDIQGEMVKCMAEKQRLTDGVQEAYTRRMADTGNGNPYEKKRIVRLVWIYVH